VKKDSSSNAAWSLQSLDNGALWYFAASALIRHAFQNRCNTLQVGNFLLHLGEVVERNRSYLFARVMPTIDKA
jgi:hypothetical protein